MRLLDAITEFLRANVPEHLFSLYSEKMEVQVQASPEGGVRTHKTFKKDGGEKSYPVFMDENGNEWKHYRIPYLDSNDEPTYNLDKQLTWDFSEHLEGIALTGWNWVDRKTHYVVFDFDSIVNHGQGLTESELKTILDSVIQVPWVSVWRSTSGTGYHIKTQLKTPVSTKRRCEHSAVAHAILNLLSEVTGLELVTSVDVFGKPHWVWHRKMLDAPKAFNIIKLAKEPLKEVPYGWQEYTTDRVRKSKPNVPTWVPDEEIDTFEGMRSGNPRVALDHDHRKLLDWLIKNKRQHWWDRENWLCVCHTSDLRDAKVALNLKGIFQTVATGKEKGCDHNCFMHPMPAGAWAVRRFNTQAEHETWEEKNGFILCYFNREPEWANAMRYVKAAKLSSKRYSCNASQLRELSSVYQLDFEPPFEDRQYVISKSGHEHPLVKVKRENDDDTPALWVEDGNKWVRVFEAADPIKLSSRFIGDTIRAVNTSSGIQYWVWNQDIQDWGIYNRTNLADYLSSMGVIEREIRASIGMINRLPWQIVSLPFQPEYPGGRRWNQRRATYKYRVTKAGGDYFPTYDRMLTHIARDLDDPISRCEICKEMGIKNGRDWMFNWLAIMVQYPYKKTHYLYIWSPGQETGKTTFHESITELFHDGVTDSTMAIRDRHNAELEGKVLATIEEVDLGKCSAAYENIKKLTATDTLLIHRKYCTPYTTSNNLHFIHCTNELLSAPVRPGDLRVVVIRVNSIPKNEYINRDVLKRKLHEESSDFLSALLNHKLPTPYKRFWLPLPETNDRRTLLDIKADSVTYFVAEINYAPGETLKLADVYNKYQDWCTKDHENICTRQRLQVELAKFFPFGDYNGVRNTIGNASFTEPSSESAYEIVNNGGVLTKVKK